MNTELSEKHMNPAMHLEENTSIELNALAGRNVLTAHHLSKSFGGQVVLNNVELNLKQGEVVLLIGENGSGKTTLLNILTGNLEPEKGKIHIAINGTREIFSFPRPWWKELNPFDHFTPERVAREGVGRVWQDIRLFPTMKTVENIAIAASNGISENPVRSFFPNTYRIDKENKRTAVKWLSMLGLGDRLDSSCDKISLGQKKRVAIVRAIQAGAKVLFLDEPLSGLDEKGVTEVVQYLQKIVKTHAVTLVIVEHSFNIPKVIGLVNKVWSLSKLNSEPGYTLTVKEPCAINTVSTDDPITHHDFWGGLAGDKSQITSDELPGGARLTTMQVSDGDDILEIKNLVIKRGLRTIFANDTNATSSDHAGLSLTLKKGQIAILEAPNGWGKSTLLDAITGIYNNSLEITAGEIYFNGNNITSFPTHQIVKMGMSYLRANQQPFGSLKVKDQLKLTRSAHSLFKDFFDATRNSKGNALSGGEKQKLLINMLPDADLYLLDEPMSGLDQSSINSFSCVLKGIANMGKTLIITIPCASKEN